MRWVGVCVRALEFSWDGARDTGKRKEEREEKINQNQVCVERLQRDLLL